MTAKKMESKVEEIEQEISSLEEEIENLKKRQKIYSKELESLTDGLVSNFDDSEARSEIRDLKSDKDVLEEVIQRKKVELQKLEENLSVKQEKYNQQKKIEDLISLAKKAKYLKDNYEDRLQELDEILKEKTVSLSRIYSDWRDSSQSFMKLADKVEKGFLQTSNLHLVREGESSNKDDLIQKLEERGIDLDSAMSNLVLKSEYYSITRSGKYPEGLMFLGFINDLLNSKKFSKLKEES